MLYHMMDAYTAAVQQQWFVDGFNIMPPCRTTRRGYIILWFSICNKNSTRTYIYMYYTHVRSKWSANQLYSNVHVWNGGIEVAYCSIALYVRISNAPPGGDYFTLRYNMTAVLLSIFVVWYGRQHVHVAQLSKRMAACRQRVAQVS